MQWSLRLYLTKHLLQSSFRNIIYLKFPSPFLLLFPQMPNIALPSGAHRNRASFSPCYTLRSIFLKIRIHTLIWQFQYHHLNHQALHIYRYFLYNAKRLKSFDLSLSCGRWDLNPHDVTTTRSLVLLVCQFRHFRVSGVPRFHISHRRILIYHSSICLASTFLNFFIFLIAYLFCSICTIFYLMAQPRSAKEIIFTASPISKISYHDLCSHVSQDIFYGHLS